MGKNFREMVEDTIRVQFGTLGLLTYQQLLCADQKTTILQLIDKMPNKSDTYIEKLVEDIKNLK